MKAEEVLINGAKELGLELTPAQVGLFLDYLNSLKFWNKKVNLTGTKDEEQIVANHFLDSMTTLSLISENSRLLDLGSGAGFPGIPLKITMPSLKITLLDLAHKKVFFVREVIRKLKLAEIEAVCGRAEDSQNGILRSSFQFVVSRAVSRIENLIELSVPYLGEEGKIILMRGPRGFDEWNRIEHRLGGKFNLVKSKELYLPFTKHRRVILVVSIV